jgi:hypothetical protein
MVYGAAVLVLTGRVCIMSVEVLLVEYYARKALEKASTYLTSSPSTDKPTRMYVPLSP